MMITRFNAESKSNCTGKEKFSVEERLGIGAVSMMGIPYKSAKEEFNISRTYYYELGKSVEPLLKSIAAMDEIAGSVIFVTKEFIERCVTALVCCCNVSVSNVIYFLQHVFQKKISKGTVYNIIQEAEKKAASYDDQISLQGIDSIATDEVFQGNRPILTGVDLDSGYVFLAQSAENRSGETWTATMETLKEKGLQAQVNVSDEGSGLRKGIQDAFPEIEMQTDIFHALRELGREISAITRKVMSDLNDFCELEYRVQTGRAHLSTRQKYYKLCQSIDAKLLLADSLNILYDWLKEYTGFTGCGYEQSLRMCIWILEEMEALCLRQDRLLKAVERFRKRLPDLLLFLPRLRCRLIDLAHEYHVPDYAFQLMYHQTAAGVTLEQYQHMEKRLYHVFRDRLIDARADLYQIIHTTYRASSPIENVNGRLRVSMNTKREISEEQLSLLKVFLNTKKSTRSRRSDRIGSSALDRLCGQNTPEFLDALFGSPNYIVAAS